MTATSEKDYLLHSGTWGGSQFFPQTQEMIQREQPRLEILNKTFQPSLFKMIIKKNKTSELKGSLDMMIKRTWAPKSDRAGLKSQCFIAVQVPDTVLETGA